MDRTYQVDGAGEEDEDEDPQSIALRLALKALPFYLSNADFVPELKEELDWLSEYLLFAKVSETQELQQSIDLYQQVSLFVAVMNAYQIKKKRAPSSNRCSGQLCDTGCDQGSQVLIDLVSMFARHQYINLTQRLFRSSSPSLRDIF
jgi:hypothetical protein